MATLVSSSFLEGQAVMSKEEWVVGIVLLVLFIGGYFLLMWLAPEWVGISARAAELDRKKEASERSAPDDHQ